LLLVGASAIRTELGKSGFPDANARLFPTYTEISQPAVPTRYGEGAAMSRSFALVTLFLSVSLVCTSSLAASPQEPASPAPAQDPAPTSSPAPAQGSTKPAPKKTKRVWTNENLGDANGTISVVGDPQKPSASKPEAKSVPDKAVDPRLVANLRQQALGLQAQLDSVDKELAALKNFSKGDSTGSGGLKTSMNYSSASVEDQIRSLTQKKSKIQGALDAVFDAARAKGIEPGQLR
jgi:hypothetical protein